MQANTLTIGTNPPATTTEDYTRHSESLDRSTYIGEAHSLQVRNTMQLYRTFPKKNGSSLGVAKAAVKITMDIEVPNALGEDVIMPLIGEASFSLPVGCTDTHWAGVVSRLRSILGSAAASALFNSLEI